MDCALALVEQGRNIRRVAKALQLARSSIQRRRSAQPPAPTVRTRGISDSEVVKEVDQVIARFPAFGYKKIAAVANRSRRTAGLPLLNHKKVYRVMTTKGLLTRKIQKMTGFSRDHKGRVAVDNSNERWCSDGLEFKCMDQQTVTVTFVKDCCDREVISFAAKTGKGLTGEMVRDALVTAVERRFNAPKAPGLIQFLTDNGAAYVARETGMVIAELGLKHCRTHVASPQSNGMAESMVRILKRHYLPFIDLTTAEKAIAALPAVVEKYNEEHPHASLHYQSPREFIASRMASSLPTKQGHLAAGEDTLGFRTGCLAEQAARCPQLTQRGV